MKSQKHRRRLRSVAGAVAISLAAALPSVALAQNTTANSSSAKPVPTTTPIKHLVVIFQENVSFDHYFGTYPHAANTDGHPFHAARHTPKVNGLSGALLTNNPNGANPSRLSPSQALTCDQNHGYTAEQKAFDGGRMDKFIPFTGNESCSPPEANPPNLVMDYFD